MSIQSPLQKKLVFFRVSIFPVWSFQNAKNGQNWINWLAYYHFSEVRMVTTDFSVSEPLLGTYNFTWMEGFFLQLINFRTKPRRKKTTFWWKVGILTPRETLNFQKLSKTPHPAEIMVIVSSFHYNRHQFILRSIQKNDNSVKMGCFELCAFKVLSKSYVV